MEEEQPQSFATSSEQPQTDQPKQRVTLAEEFASSVQQYLAEQKQSGQASTSTSTTIEKETSRQPTGPSPNLLECMTEDEIQESQLYIRINEVAQSALRGLDEYKFVTLDDAKTALSKFKKKHPKSSKPRKKGYREEDDQGSEGELDPSIQLRGMAKLLKLGDNTKAELFQAFLAKHFFRGVVDIPEHKGNCAILAFMCQVNNLPPELRAINIRCWMCIYLLENHTKLMKFIGPFLKDVGHSVYSYAQSLLDEENFIDQAGLVIMRHMVGELPIVIAQVTATKLKTHQEMRYTTAAGAVIQLMGSDEQFSLPEFPVVLAYNRIHHYLPTAYLSDDSLANWRLAQIYKHFTAAHEYFLESMPHLGNEPDLVQAMDQIFVGVNEVQGLIKDRAKLGTTAATSVPITLTGKKPKRDDLMCRRTGLPSRDTRLIPMPQPVFQNLADNPALPDYIFQGQPETSAVTTSVPIGALTSTFVASSHTTPADKRVGPPGLTSSSQIPSSQPTRQKRKATKQPILEEDTIDDEDRDPDFNPLDIDDDDEQTSASGGATSSVVTSGLSLEESISKGIPQLPKRRNIVPESKKKHRCQVCGQGFQKTNELKDHNYTKHMGGSFSCADCCKEYANEKGLKYHLKTIHKGEGRCKCPEEGCTWQDKDSGKLHNHLLTAHDIGQPLVCQVTLEDGSLCKKVFKNTRLFKTHAAFHLEKKFKCNQCDRHFSTESNRKTHIHRYHKATDDETQYQCEFCGKTFDMESQLTNHRNLHRLKHHKMLQAEKKAAEAAEKGSSQSVQQGESSSQPTHSQSSAEPVLPQLPPEEEGAPFQPPGLPAQKVQLEPPSLPVSFNLPQGLTATQSQMFEGQVIIGTAIKVKKSDDEQPTEEGMEVEDD